LEIMNQDKIINKLKYLVRQMVANDTYNN
jgi:hypothetical protein